MAACIELCTECYNYDYENTACVKKCRKCGITRKMCLIFFAVLFIGGFVGMFISMLVLSGMNGSLLSPINECDIPTKFSQFFKQ